LVVLVLSLGLGSVYSAAKMPAANEKVNKKKMEVAKVRVKLKSNGIPGLKHNHYATSSTPMV